MNIEKYRLEIILTTIIISVLIVSATIIYFLIADSFPTSSSLNGSANIYLEKVEFNETIEVEYVELVDSDLEGKPSLTKAIEAWENPDKYENAYMWNNKTLIYIITSTEAEELLVFLQGKLYQKYSRHIESPYYIKYNQEFYSCWFGLE